MSRIPRFVLDVILLLFVLFLGTEGESDTCETSQLQDNRGSSGGNRDLLQVDGCPCSGNGACASSILNGTICECFKGFGGLDCSLQCPEGFSGADCSILLDCRIYGHCHGHGVCVTGGECLCNTGWFGSDCSIAKCPRNCSSHGSCNHSNGRCLCDPGWGGRACSTRICAGNCSSHGLCIQGICECYEGFSGDNCAIFTCIGGCSGNGECNEAGQKCDCSPWFTGDDCSTPVCPSACSGHGNCLNGDCICDFNWTGYDCANQRCNNDCSGHGTCQQTLSESGIQGMCVCEAGYVGDSCLAVACPNDCSNHGLCFNGTCTCDPGFGGDDCALTLKQISVGSRGCSNNCSNHGSCNSGFCLCDTGWGGKDCSANSSLGGCIAGCSGKGSCINASCVCDNGWAGLACDFSAVDNTKFCALNCSFGSGVFSNGTCICSMASDVASSDCRANCSLRGTCNQGECVCNPGFTGSACENPILYELDLKCKNNCTGHGTCSNGTCVCDDGWSSADCSQFLGQGNSACSKNCSSQGTCLNGTCVCDRGFVGADCSVAVGVSSLCDRNCSGHGSCINTTCFCDLGFSGRWCHIGFTSSSTSAGRNSTVTAIHVCKGDCNGHGSCMNGFCVCDSMYRGVGCEFLTIVGVSFCPQDCSGHGTCLNGTCSCDINWAGEDCSAQSGCLGSSRELNISCSGHGTCHNRTCICEKFWSGPDCSEEPCASGCSKKGICLNGTCACQPGWSGPSCASLSCPRDCAGHGSCSTTAWHSPQCTCDEGWQGSDCSVQMCPSIYPGSSCSGHGACTHNGTCICYASWAGADCSQLIDCSTRGKRVCGFCVCLEGFTGSNCEVDICADSRIYDPLFPGNLSKASVCSNRGTCTTDNGCTCQQGWAGKTCTNPAVCPQNCSGHGTCSGSRDNDGQCSCITYDLIGTPFKSPLYTGADCSFKRCPGYIDGASGQECSGRGTCQGRNNIYACTCFRNPATNQPYMGDACSRPPQFFLQNIIPAVGPLEGGTVVEIVGPGIELLLQEQRSAVYCVFGGYLSALAYYGLTRDRLACKTPAAAVAGLLNVSLMGLNNQILRDPLTGAQSISNSLQFEYFAQTQIIRVSPSFSPLRPTGPRRWIGPWDAYGSRNDGSNVITITGSYFPANGIYLCRFGDCRSNAAVRVNAVTMTCVMPSMAEALELEVAVSSNGQQFSNTGGKASKFKTYSITAITPVCGSVLGTAKLTVFGKNLVDTADPSRSVAAQYCRFGRTSSTGQTRTADPGKKLLAFYSNAVTSSKFEDALECAVPNWPVEEDDFALSLDAKCGIADCSNGDLNAYYTGQWDAFDDLRTEMSYMLTEQGIPQGVKFSSFYQSEISVRSELRVPVIQPTIGPVSGGTYVTITGYGFDYPRYGPNTPNSQYKDPWTPEQVVFPSGEPRCSVLTSPQYRVGRFDYISSPAACRFGTDITTELIWLSAEKIVCVSPSLLEAVDSPTDVTVEVALDGQTYTSNGYLFQYVPPGTVERVSPSTGVSFGGTPIIIEGKNFVESATLSNDGSTAELSCVFIISSPKAERKKMPGTLRSCSDSNSVGCKAVSCLTPNVTQAQAIRVDISMSGQTDDSQLTGSKVEFIMFSNPEISDLIPSVGTTEIGDETSRLVKIFFSESKFPRELLLPGVTNNMQCKFGAMDPVPAKIELATDTVSASTVNYMYCSAPKVSIEQTVNLAVTLNGLDWSTKNVSYTYIKISGVLTPSSGPIAGGTKCSLILNNKFYAKARFGESEVGGRPLGDLVEFTTPRVTSTGQVLVALILDLASMREDPRRSMVWIDVGLRFFFYDVQGMFSSILPCSNYKLNKPECGELFMPKNGRQSSISIYINRAMVANELDSLLISSTTIKCIYSTSASGPSEFCARYIKKETYGLISCATPSVDSSSPVESYNVTVALNGQNPIEKDFRIQYVATPTIISVKPTAGQISGGMLITLSASSWLDSKGRIPPLLSCSFFNVYSGELHYVSVLNPACDNVLVTGTCTVNCLTPQFARSADDSCPSVQIFLSVNQRDPCISLGCSQGCKDCNCSMESSGLYENQMFTVYNSESNSWCPTCGGSTKCSDLTCQTGGATFQYYTDPVIFGMSPTSLSNKLLTGSISVTLFGALPICSTLREVLINANYVDGTKSAVFQTPVPWLGMSATRVAFQLPLPCPTSFTNCQRNTTFNFTQNSDILVVQISASFNGGGQFSESLEIEIYGPNLASECPKDGCGHGTCVKVMGLDGKTAANSCLCGYWGDSQSGEICGLKNSSANEQYCECTDSSLQSPSASCPFSQNNVACHAPDPKYTVFDKSKPSWFCSTLQPPSNPSAVINAFGPEFWTGTYRPTEIRCSGSPLIVMFRPSVGIGVGGTTVQFLISALNGFSDQSSIGIIRNTACYFGGVIARNISVLPGTVPGTYLLNCSSPKNLQVSSNAAVSCSFLNSAGIASPLNFPNLSSLTFLYTKKPTVTNISLEICVTSNTNCVYFNEKNLSAPVCVGQCNRETGERNILKGMAIFVKGINFENVDSLVCCFSSSIPCSQSSPSRLVSKGEFVSSTQVRCPIFMDPIDAGRYRLAVSLNGQEYSDLTESPFITFYQPPMGMNGAAVDQKNSGSYFGYGVQSVVEERVRFMNLGPIQGDSPLIFYFAEQCTTASCSTSSLSIPTFRSNSTLMFVPCPNSVSLESCTCSQRSEQPVFLSRTNLLDSDGVSMRILDSTNLVFTLKAVSPSVIAAGAGRFLICFAVNGIHFLPITTISSSRWNNYLPESDERFSFLFYPAPIISRIVPASGPYISPGIKPYDIFILGENFLSDVLPPYIYFCADIHADMQIVGCSRSNTVIINTSNINILNSSAISVLAPVNIKFSSVNVTLSYNLFDFSPIGKGMTDFRFYDTPTISNIFPAWGLFGYDTTVTILGSLFENLPLQSFCIFSKCVDPLCTDGKEPRIFRATTYISSTAISCISPSKPPDIEGESSRAMNMYVTFSPDGRNTTRYATGMTSLWEQISLRGGKPFQFSDPLSKVLQSSSLNLPLDGGKMDLSVFNQFWCPISSSVCRDCMEIHTISSVVVSLIPSDLKLRRSLGVITSTISSRTLLTIPDTESPFPKLEQNCLVTISVVFPPIRFPLVADLKISFDGGQQYTGSPKNILIYRQIEPVSIFPLRASRSSPSRPSVNVYFSQSLLSSTGPSITPSQAVSAFSGPKQSCSPFCNMGPRCRFDFLNMSNLTAATFRYDDQSPYLTCTAPPYPSNGSAQVFVSFDGFQFFSSKSCYVYFFNEPFIDQVFPTTGFWTAKTQLLISGDGFLGAGTNYHQTWCVFDFQDILPTSDQWSVPRLWSKAFPICSSSSCNNIHIMSCSAPVIEASARPTLPRYPRARLGLIVDGYCTAQSATGDCTALMNANGRGRLQSNAFFFYSDLPAIAAVVPQAGVPFENLDVTITGSGFVDQYNWGSAIQDVDLLVPFERRQTQKLCVGSPGVCTASADRFPCPGLTCRFGRTCTCPQGTCVDLVSNVSAIFSQSSPNQVICKVPPLFVDNLNSSIFNLSVSLNGEPFEFSSPLSFVLVDLKVGSVSPSFGSAAGGGILSVFGDNFQNISCGGVNGWACLHCRFVLTGPSSIAQQQSEQLVAAVYVNSNFLTCSVPSASAFGVLWEAGNMGKLPAACSNNCILQVSVSVNKNTYTLYSAKTSYLFKDAVLFSNIGSNSSVINGNISVLVYASNLDIGSQVQCMFGNSIVQAVVSTESVGNGYVTCPVPAVSMPGPVDFGLGINAMDFCYLVAYGTNKDCVRSYKREVGSDGVVIPQPTLWPDEKRCQCLASYGIALDQLPKVQKFVYHDAMQVLNIVPPSGIESGGTEILLHGKGFKNYGQALFVYFGVPPTLSNAGSSTDFRVAVPATILSSSVIKCLAPARPVDTISDSQSPPGTYAVFIKDVAVPVQVSSNGLQFTAVQDGSACVQNAANAISRDNKKAQCILEFVMYTWFSLPEILGVVGPVPAENIYPKLANAAPSLYDSLSIMTQNIPQGLVTGSTKVTLLGNYFVSMARAEVVNGQGTSVECSGAASGGVVPPGKSCTTTCVFPFAASITGPGIKVNPPYPYYYGCVNLPFTITQQQQTSYWCAVQDQPPAIFNGKYGYCRNDISIWKDYNQGGKVISSLECRFGDIHVPATVVPLAATSTQNPELGRQITCESPPYQFGIMVPLSVTLNRVDYSAIQPFTYFQYLKPAPVPVEIKINPSVSQFTLIFDGETNMAGQRLNEQVFCETMKIFADGNLPVPDKNFIGLGGMFSSPPLCQWIDRVSLSVQLGIDFSLENGTMIPFKKIPCDIGSSADCWRWDYFKTLRLQDDHTTDVLSKETGNVGCRYPRHPSLPGSQECSSSVIQSTAPGWCGACLPTSNEVTQLSLPFNRSISHLSFTIAKKAVLAPVPVIVGPSSVDNCESRCYQGSLSGKVCTFNSDCPGGTCKISLVRFDATTSVGDLGKPFQKIVWSLDANPKYVQDIDPPITSQYYNMETGTSTRMLANQYLTPTFFPSSAQKVAARYCFILTLTNWLGGVGVSANCFVLSLSIGIPVPQIVMSEGGSMTSFTKSKDLILSANVGFSACAAGKTFTASFQWSISPDVTLLPSPTIDFMVPKLLIRAYSVPFVSNQQYTFTFNATMSDSSFGTSSSTKQITLKCIPSPPTVNIEGGLVQTYSPAHGPLIIDASRSFDTDKIIDNRSPRDLLFCWKCSVVFRDCRWTTNSNVSIDRLNTSILTIAPGSIDLNATYTVDLSVYQRTVSDLSCQSVSLTSIPKTAVSIVLYTTKNAPKVSVSYPRTRFVSASSQFRISGTIYFGTTGDNLQTCGCMYSWKVVPQLPIVFMKGVSGVSCGRVDLMVSSGAFSSVSALSYRVQLSATCDSTSGMAAIDIQSVTPPTSGSCGVTPTVGIAFQTLFTSSCVNWADDLDSLPIRYRFLISSVISGDRFVLAPWSENSILTTVLPSGDSGSNFALQMITEVNNNFGVVAKQFSQTITCNPRTFSGPAQVQTSLNQMSNDLSSYRLNSQDVNVMMGKIGTLALSLNDISSVASRSQLLYIQNLREQVVKTITDLSAPGHKRRLLDVSLCPTSLYSSTVAMFVSRLQLSTTTTAPDTLSMSTCDSAKQSISCYLLSGNDLGVDSEDADQVALDLFKTLTNCANQSNITELYSTLRTLSIVAMKERNSADDILRYRHRGLAMISKRYSVSDFGEKNLTIYPQINITIPGSLGREIPQSTAVDALVISMTTSQNPYKSLSNQQVFGPIAEISMHSAFQQEGTLSSIQLLYQIQNVSNIAVRDLKTPITIVFSLDTKPEFKYNHATEVFKASACSFYNTTSSLWTPFGINFAAACEPQCPWNTPSNKDLSRLVCPTTHLTAFSAVETTVGCDFVPSLIPKQTDICCLCDGAGKSCCDWRRIDSANNIASQAPCPQTDDGQGLDSCLVCQKNVESVLTKPFVSLQFKNVSGICDYRGIPCTNNMIPNACGVCDLPDNELQRKANSGLCDCDPVNPRLPNEQGGGKILDRCGICDGGNKSMDDCGTNPDIPAYDPSGLFEVCHSGGRGKTQVPRWNMACTGCDNVTRPDLPFNLSRRPYPGGVQIDKCGICGGDNSACVGCDRVPGSSKKIDFCGVCGGTNDSCIGCDKVRNPRPTVLDLCGICGGSNYGACKISYTYDFTQIIVLNLLWQNFGPSRQQILEASLVSVVQGLSGTSMVQVHIASFVTGTSAGTTQIKFKVIAPDRTAATTTLRITFRNEPSRPNTFLLDLQNAIRKAGDSDLAGSLPNAIDSQPTPQIMEDKTTFPCNYATLQPREICQMDCAGVASGGAVIDRCGVCGGDGSSCSITAECPVTNCTTCCGCDSNLQPIFPDKCGKCGGDSTSCAGCDGKPFSGKLYDFCGVCGGDNTSCIGCDGVVHSGKVKDLCGICDGGNRRRDVCGSCITDNSQGLSCAGCDGVPFSGKSIDACGVCGGTNQCKWRDGQPPADSKGSTAAVVMLVSLQT